MGLSTEDFTDYHCYLVMLELYLSALAFLRKLLLESVACGNLAQQVDMAETLK